MNEIEGTYLGQPAVYRLPGGWELRDDLLQADLEKWEAAYNKKPSKGLATDSGSIVRAALEAGWFLECPIELKDIPRTEPKQLNQTAQFINAVYNSYKYVPDFLS